ncbi:hypothetical protein PISMIDRAFT_674672 [Pisolithus microcarpus 441]|uniref:HECT-type E3 ubiquitin transferase n=1 Tax=Pisolithus microcarpus 441 TaxID=765257 RepID=A0A0C9ZZT8_9AGAM|nr:hypothetical protein PISMIDRAFT_674672 [Pisolithus microcarpus 441]
MKISQKSRKAAQPHPQVAELIEKLSNTPEGNIADVLTQIDSWKWPRSDLNAWVKVLDKFDAILGDAISDYNVDKLQLNPFSPATKRTLCEILRFERLLLENSTNRKTFNSYDRLTNLMSTSDLDVLILALNLLLRPAQQYSAQPAVSVVLSISTPRLLSLSKRWPNVHEHGISLLDLASPTGLPKANVLPSDVREVSFVYYKTDHSTKEKPEDENSEPPASACKTQAPNPGPININLCEERLLNADAMNILADTLEVNPLSDDDKFELLCRIRTAKALVTENQTVREKLVIVRLLSIAIYCHTHSESQATSSLFLYEPDLATHIAELLQLDRGVSAQVQSAAIAALDSIARYRSRIQEVLAAVNAGVNHGILMALLRKIILEVSDPESKLANSFVEALLAFITYVAQHAGGGNMVVGAGLIPLLVQIIENRLAQRLQMVSKAMQLVDNVVYGYSNAFQLFSNARGVIALVDRIQHEVDFDITMYRNETPSQGIFGSYGDLPVARAAVLKHALRSIHRMMQSSGTAEGLRGLIDSSLLQSVKKIMVNRGLFGPSVLPLAMNIMATFVHNEPTSLPTIQEAGLPQVFYQAIEDGLEPFIEVVQAIPNAIGALCLNQAGQDQLAARPSIIPGIFSIFTSDPHLKVLRDKENAVLIGTSIDELIRHHPSLKAPVFEAVKSTLSKIEDAGNAFIIPEDKKEWYELLTVQPAEESTEVAMEGVESETPQGPASLLEEDNFKQDATQTDHDNNVVMYIDVICRFLEGLFQHPQHCKDFINTEDGLDRIGRLTALPCLPYDYANSVASDSLVQVIRTMAEIGPNDTLSYLSKLVAMSLDQTEEFWKFLAPESRLASMLKLNGDQALEVNQRFRNLVVLHIRVTLMADVFSTTGYAHGRSAIGLLQTLMSDPPKVVTDLGSLHRAFVWENILFKAYITSEGIELGISGGASPLDRSPIHLPIPLPEAGGGATVTNGVQSDSALGVSSSSARLIKETVKDKNAKALKHLTHGLPTALAPFFQAIVKLFYARRNPDSAQKKQILSAADIVAGIMIGHIKQELTDDTLRCLDYYSVMLGVMTSLLVDERTMQSTLHTVLLLAFQRMKGLEAIFGIIERFVESAERVTSVAVSERSELMVQELVRAHGGLKVALHLLRPLLSSKPLLESGQTMMMITRDKKDTDLGYFEPHHFLVTLRLAVIPIVRKIWESAWLRTAPLTLVKSVIHLVLELTSGDSEELRADAPGDSVPGTGIGIGTGFHIRTVGPDENRIRQLTDMGFQRSAVERALTRTRNNINAATELLLSHQFLLPPEPEPQYAEAATSTDTSGHSPTEGGESDGSAMQDSGVDADEPSAREQSVTTPEGTKSFEELRRDLDIAREPLRTDLASRALVLVDEYPSLIFDVCKVFVQPSADVREISVRSLIEDIKVHSPGAYDVREEPLAIRCRLLALALSECQSLEPALGRSLMDILLALLSNSTIIDPEHHLPKWLASHLLVTEALLNIGDQPSSINLPKEGDPIELKELKVGPAYTEARPLLFDFSFRLLNLCSLPRDEFLATLRLLVVLTRDHLVACEFTSRGGLPLVFKHLQACPGPSSYSYVAIILRHVAEDPNSLRNLVRQEIKRFFSQPRTRLVEASTYLRNNSAAALRDPRAFIDVTMSLCELQHPYDLSHHIGLKSDVLTETSLPKDNSAKQAEMQVDSISPDAPQVVTNEALESMVHFLITELMRCFKTVLNTPCDTSVPPQAKEAVNEVAPTDSATQASDQDNSGQQQRYLYSSFIMQCLTELLFSYDSCKNVFLSYNPKKRVQTPSKESGVKYRTAVLQFFLSELVTYETVSTQLDESAKARLTLCGWAISVIVALCVDSSWGSEVKDVSPDLVSVRKFVLEAVSRAIKEMPATESLDMRYGRLLALADLCNRLLTVRCNNGSRKPQDESATHIAKIMLEKNFVSTLTSALSEVDLNFPNIRGLVASVLRPLENLSRIAIKMSRPSDKAKGDAEGKAETSGDSSDGEEDEREIGVEDDAGREETPDLYRNSALGMYEMDDVNYPPDNGMEEGGEEDEEGDVDMEFGDETDSEATSPSDEEDDTGEAEDQEDEESHDGEDSWQDEDEEYGEDHLIENDDDDGRDADADQELDADMIWQDVHGDVGPQGEAGEEGEDEDGGVPIPVVHEEQEDEPDMSDDDEFRGEIVDAGDVGPIPGEDVLTFADAYDMDGVDVDGRDGNFFLSRRNRAGPDDLQIFGRARNAPSAPTEATVHPLLLDESAGNNRASTSFSRNIRRPHRGNSHSLQTELIQSVEDIIGGDAVQVFQQVVHRATGTREPIRVDVASGAWVNLEPGVTHRLVIPGVRLERALARQSDNRSDIRGLDPLPTSQRWNEEAKMLNGKHVADRASQLANHAVLALLPAAIEAAVTKEREEQKRQAQIKAEEATKELEAQQTTVQAETPSEVPQASQPEPIPTPAEDVEMRDVTVTDSDRAEPTSAEAEEAATETLGPTAGPSQASERVTIAIHGSEVDITDMGIDPTFLEALPDDIREEVINQHVRDQRSARVERPADSQISPEFLEALPPEIRAELIQQERMEQVRQTQVTAPNNAGIPAEIDPASFIASLDPQLRQVVLLDSDDGLLQTLPSYMIAEAGVYRDEAQAARRYQYLTRDGHHTTSSRNAPPRKQPPPRDAIQLLDKTGVASLVRLLFFPQNLKKNPLLKVLVNLCENSKTRTELFNLVLSILQSGPGDLATVDRSFAQMTTRTQKASSQPTLRAAEKQRVPPESGSSVTLTNQSDSVPDLVVQRSLEALTYIVSANELSSLFFLTEHELPAGLKKLSTKKGKGKEKQAPQTHYPINLHRVPADQTDKTVLLQTPPQIPHSVLRLIVNILTVGECSARTFQQSLTLIQNLSHIPDARDVIAQELRTKAQDCGQNILFDLNDLWAALQSPDQDVLASSIAPKFSSPSSDQTKLLRVLKTIDYMYTPRTNGPTAETQKDRDSEKVQTIYDSFRFTPLWRRLGDCLAVIEDKPDLEHIATVLLPLIESLMVVCKYVGSKSVTGIMARALRASASPRPSTSSSETMEELFVSFTDAHRKILNVMVRNNPSLMSGSFSLLVHNPRVLDFDNKRNYFTQQLHRRPHSREHHGTLQLNVRRARVFEDSFQYLQRKTGDQIKYGKLSVRFYDEEGVDAGGVTREWFQILARQMFDPNYALFQPCAADKLTYQPNKNSWVNPEHLSFFKFVGRVIGKAIYDGRLLDAYFAKSLYRQLLGKPVDHRDVEWVDPEYYNSLCWILENDPTPLELTFSVEADEFGRNRIFPLKSGGESIHVTQENKREFVQLSAIFRLYSSISEQIEHLVSGFYEIIPKDLISIFNEQELELLISGTPDIDVDEWRAATEYNGYTSSDPVIVWWWRALKSFNREERAKVLSFATGTSRVPLNGFTELQGVQGVQRFSIHRAYGDPDRLPQAHTCFNQIDLPQYSSYEMLRQQLLLAISEGGEGFGFA